MRLTKYQYRIKCLKRWSKWWGENPEHMEQARQRGVLAMQQNWKERNENLGMKVAPWPRKMSKADFKERVQALIDSPENLRSRKHSPQRHESMVHRLRINGFVKYDRNKRVWINLCYRANYTEGGSENNPTPPKESFPDQS